MSKSPNTEKVPDCKGVYLPYLPRFTHAGINSVDAFYEVSIPIFETVWMKFVKTTS